MARFERRRVLSSVGGLWTFVAIGCGGPAAPLSPEPSPTITPATPHPSATPPPIASSPSAPSTGDAAPPPPPPPPACARLGWVDACAKHVERTWLDADAVEAWYKSRGATRPQGEIEPACREIIVGPGGEAALLCERIQHETRGQPGAPLHTFRVLAFISVRTVRGKAVVNLLEAPFQVDLLDKEELDEGPLFALELNDLELPSQLVLREPGDGACAKAEQRLKADRDQARASKDLVMAAWTRLDEEMRARICSAAGSYRFQNGRFMRAK